MIFDTHGFIRTANLKIQLSGVCSGYDYIVNRRTPLPLFPNSLGLVIASHASDHTSGRRTLSHSSPALRKLICAHPYCTGAAEISTSAVWERIIAGKDQFTVYIGRCGKLEHPGSYPARIGIGCGCNFVDDQANS